MSILPQFINLDDKAPQRPHFALPLIVDYSALDDTPIDPVQCTAVYRYKTSIGKELHQFELQGVDIQDTRLSRAQEKLEALRARLTATEGALDAARELIATLPESYAEEDVYWQSDNMRCVACYVYVWHTVETKIEPHKADCVLIEKKQAYTAALARLAEVTE